MVSISETRNAYEPLLGKPLGKWSFEIQRMRWENNIKMDLQEVSFEYRSGPPTTVLFN
jgi:hypothetical protein